MAAGDDRPPMSAVPGAPLIEGYVIDREVGRGGFATVYAASQTAVAGRVAIKVINAGDTDPDVLLRFERESWALGALRGHPHIVTVLDAGQTDDGRPYLVMELVGNGSFHDELVRRMRADEGPFPLGTVLDIGVKVASAVAAAHQQGILHRDLKPGNILRSDYGEPLLGDFGIARLADQDASVNGQVLSAGFSAPEIIRGESPTVASDMFSLGCTLFTLLTGRSPFRRPGDVGLLPALNRTVDQPVPDLRPTGTPDEVCALLERSMAKDPSDRHVDAAAFAAEIQQVQARLGHALSSAPFADATTTSDRIEDGPATALVDVARDLPPPAAPSPAADAPTAAPPAPATPSPRRRRAPLVFAGLLVGVGLAVGLFFTFFEVVDDDAEGNAADRFDMVNPLVRGPSDVRVPRDRAEAASIASFYGRWGAALNGGDLRTAFALYDVGADGSDSFAAFEEEWRGFEVRGLDVVDIGRSGSTTVTSLQYVTTIRDDRSGTRGCLQWEVEHVLHGQDDMLQITEESLLGLPSAC